MIKRFEITKGTPNLSLLGTDKCRGKEWVSWLQSQVAKGDKGDRGESAYQYAQSAGYAGTEEEFAEALERLPEIYPTIRVLWRKFYDDVEYRKQVFAEMYARRASNGVVVFFDDYTDSANESVYTCVNITADAALLNGMSSVTSYSARIDDTAYTAASVGQSVILLYSDGTFEEKAVVANFGDEVKWGQAQNLSEAAKAQARDNIGAGIHVKLVQGQAYPELYERLTQEYTSGSMSPLTVEDSDSRTIHNASYKAQGGGDYAYITWVETDTFSLMDVAVVAAHAGIINPVNYKLTVFSSHLAKEEYVDESVYNMATELREEINTSKENAIETAQDYTNTAIQAAITTTLNTPV